MRKFAILNGREKKLQKKEGESKTFLENSCMESITGSFQVKNTEFQTFQVDMVMKQSVTVLCRLQCSSGQTGGMSSSPLNYWHRRELLLSILKLKLEYNKLHKDLYNLKAVILECFHLSQKVAC